VHRFWQKSQISGVFVVPFAPTKNPDLLYCEEQWVILSMLMILACCCHRHPR
jgi:hypothetical protein